LAHGVALVGI